MANEHKQPPVDNPEEQQAGSDEPEAEAGEQPGTEEASWEALQSTLQDAQAKADEYWNQLVRTRAELENVQRRSQQEIDKARKYGLEKFVEELLPVKDSLELGLVAASEANADVEKLREGSELTLKMMSSALEKFGVTELDPQGEKFNPEQHQAMSTQPRSDVEPNTVLTVYQKGYMLNDRLVRPALVVVSASTDGEGGGKGSQVDAEA